MCFTDGFSRYTTLPNGVTIDLSQLSTSVFYSSHAYSYSDSSSDSAAGAEAERDK